MLFGFEKKNETSQSLREYAKNYLISEMSCFTVYFQSSKYATKLRNFINILRLLLQTLDTYGVPICKCATPGDHVIVCM